MTLQTRNHALIGQFLRFSSVGVVGLIADLTALAFALNALQMDVYSGRVFSYVMAATMTWAIHRRLTFRDADKRNALRQWASYLVLGALGGAVNFAVYTVILLASQHIMGMPSGWDILVPYVGVSCGAVAALLVNFLVAKRFVFR